MTRHIPGFIAAVTTLTIGFAPACGESNEPSLEGPPFFSAWIDGVAWEPGPGAADLVAVLQAGRAFIVANRFLEAEQIGELVQLEFDTPNVFRVASYQLGGGPEGFAVLRVQRGGDPDALYQTNPQHTGLIAVRAADPTDSVVTGSFAFEAEQLGGAGLRRLSGSFRVRFVNQFPVMSISGHSERLPSVHDIDPIWREP